MATEPLSDNTLIYLDPTPDPDIKPKIEQTNDTPSQGPTLLSTADSRSLQMPEASVLPQSQGHAHIDDSFLAIKTSGQGVSASNTNSVYQGLSNINIFSQLLLLFSGLMPALADTFALLKSFLSKAAWEQTEAASSIKMVHQLLNCLHVAVSDPQHFLQSIWLWNGHQELEPAIDFKEAQKQQHDILHHSNPLVNFTPTLFNTFTVILLNLSFATSKHP
uniref:Uncharacterized protein n=1 Tax=Moniliophthora roreri TaxID=221103 RepID=A0A0W0F9V9_MONRR